ncbi:hypothetical protein Hanom_Chr14g01309941 [Helianthus anomalus]
MVFLTVVAEEVVRCAKESVDLCLGKRAIQIWFDPSVLGFEDLLLWGLIILILVLKAMLVSETLEGFRAN